MDDTMLAEANAIRPQASDAVASNSARASLRAPSLLMVNVFMIFGLLILVFLSPSVEDTFRLYMLGVGIECALALLTVIFMRLERLDVRQTARLHWPGWSAILWTLMMAPGLLLLAVGFNLLMAGLLGYTTPVSPAAFPKTLADAAALLLATVVAAPLCEELMFRGYVQRAYERGSPWIGVSATALLFTLYHLRFQGAFALLPVSLALGFVVWRTHSLLPGILLHALYNGVAAGMMVAAAFLPLPTLGLLAMLGCCACLLTLPALPLALWQLWRATAPPQPPSPETRLKWQRWLWPVPLAALLALYAYAAVVEIIVGGFPERLAVEALTLEAPAAWETAPTWAYKLYNGYNEEVGWATCSVEPAAGQFVLDCAAEREAFSLPRLLPERWLGNARAAEAATWAYRATWLPEAALDLVAVEGVHVSAGNTVKASLVKPAPGEILLTIVGADATPAPLSLPGDVLLQGEWPWRLAGLPFDIAYGAARPYGWFDAAGAFHLETAYVLVEGAQPIWTPAGNFVAWKVLLKYTDAAGKEVALAAWYDAAAPYTLVRYDDGVVSYLLEE